MDTRLDGMLYAVVARPPVYGGQGRELRRRRRAQGPGRRARGGRSRARPAPASFNPLGGVAVIAKQHLGGDAGPQGAEDRVGRRPERGATTRWRSRRRSRKRRASRARSSATTGTSTAGMAGAAKRHRGGVLHPPPRARDHGAAGGRRAHRSGQVRGVGLLPVTPGRARPGREAAGHVSADVTVHVTLLGGGFGRKSKPDFGIEAAVLSQGDGRQAGQGDLDARGRPAPHATTTRSPWSTSRRASTRSGRPVAWLHRSVAPTIMSTFERRREAGGELGARDGRHQRPLRDPQRPHREPGGLRPHADRLVPLRLEHSPRVRRPVVRRRARRGGGPRPEGVPARCDRAGALDHAGHAEGHVEPRREPGALSRRHRPAAARRGDARRARRGWGRNDAEGPRVSASRRTTAS